MKENIKFILQLCCCLIASTAICFLLLVLAYMLPTDRMRENVAVSSEQVSEEGSYYQWAKGYKNAQTDTYSDASLILNAIYPGSGSAIKDAMNNPRILYGDDNNEESVVLLASQKEAETQIVNYGRYWHGSLIFLKPALLFFDLGDIRMFSMILQTGLLFLVIAGFTKREKMKSLPGFFIAVIMINPVTMVMGFCFAVEYTLMLIMIVLMLFYHERLEKKNRYYFFFLFSGILFVYFNELCFPVLGLGIPLTVYLLLSKETVHQKIKREAQFTAMWVIGYAAVWMGKWMLAWMFTGYNYFLEALRQAKRYTSDHATWEIENPTLADRLYKNINVYLKWPFALVIILVLILIFIYMLHQKERITKEKIRNMLPFFLIVLLPFAVFTALGNGYSYVHYWFTHRLLSISAFAGICMLQQLTDKKEK